MSLRQLTLGNPSRRDKLSTFFGKLAEYNTFDSTQLKQNVATTLRDWNRGLLNGLTTCYFNHKQLHLKKALTEESLESEINSQLSRTPLSLRNYIKYFSHQDGFFNISNTVTFGHLMAKKQFLLSVANERFDFIENPDGSVTFMERFQIVSFRGKEGDMENISQSVSSNPIAIIVTESTIKLGPHNEIIHKLKKDTIFLLDPLGEELFETDIVKTAKNNIQNLIEPYDHAVKEKYNKSLEINNRIECDIILNVLKTQWHYLKDDFTAEKALEFMDKVIEAYGIANEKQKNKLARIVQLFVDFIHLNTKLSVHEKIDEAWGEKRKLFDADHEAAYNYSGSSVQPLPDQWHDAYQVSDAERKAIQEKDSAFLKIKNALPFQRIIDQICVKAELSDKESRKILVKEKLPEAPLALPAASGFFKQHWWVFAGYLALAVLTALTIAACFIPGVNAVVAPPLAAATTYIATTILGISMGALATAAVAGIGTAIVGAITAAIFSIGVIARGIHAVVKNKPLPVNPGEPAPALEGWDSGKITRHMPAGDKLDEPSDKKPDARNSLSSEQTLILDEDKTLGDTEQDDSTKKYNPGISQL